MNSISISPLAIFGLILFSGVRGSPLVMCPTAFGSCECRSPSQGLLSIDCSRRNLSELPNQIDGFEHSIYHLDLSYNNLKLFPIDLEKFTALESLDFSNNEISVINDTASLPPNLRQLYLSNNNITNWMDLNPSKLLLSAINLHTLSLAGNPLRSLTSNDERLLLISPSLKLLDLSDCAISKISGRLTVSGLLNLEHLLLSGNPLHTMPQLKADKMLSLDLSSCKLTYLHHDVFESMPMLTYVNLSKNPRLSLQRNKSEFVQSASLRRIDLTMCNMDAVELKGFPNLTTAVLKGNMITQLAWDTFEDNDFLENIDLSFNSIGQISSGTFRRMNHLKNLDFSFNMIRRIEPDTFRDNDHLTSINLSRNYIERFRRMTASSLTYLNMSWCEIINIDLDAFNDMPDLIELDLSNNLIRDFPSSLHSATLQILDLSTCRLSTIDNETFAGFPELSRLNLAGNRFTTTFRMEYFAANPYLNDIWLGDNPWRCECWGYGLQEFYQFLTVPPARVNDRSYLRCTSPENAFSKLWNTACHDAWYPNTRKMGPAEKAWTITMIAIIIASVNFCIYLSFKKWIRGRALQRREQERLQVIEDAREIMRHNRRVLEQEAQLNAPDPRETHPPCYEDAILLPRLDSSFASLKRLDAEGDSDERRKAAKRSRCRSEEVICSRRGSDDGSSRPKRHILAARIRSTRPVKVVQTLFIPPRSPNSNPAHYHSTEILNLKHGPGLNGNGYVVDGASHASSTSEFVIEPMERFINFAGRSPYAQRRLASNLSTFQPSTSSLCEGPSHIQKDVGDDIVIIEDHYRSKNSLSEKQLLRKISCSSTSSSFCGKSSVSSANSNRLNRNSTSSSSSEEYSTFTTDEIQNVKRSNF